MLRYPELPFLPGFVMRDPNKNRFHLSQYFEVRNGISMLADNERTADDKFRQILHGKPSFYPPFEGPKLPPWVAYDKKVLCFHAFFKESLNEVFQASHQVRKVKILYYLEDGTMQVSEPRIDNSGLSQGCIVSRQKIPRTNGSCEYLSILDLNVNSTIQIFDRVYFISGCDQFTRNFLNRAGVAVADKQDTPSDPGQELRKKAAMVSEKVPFRKDKLAQFLKNDRKVLLFYGYWDDRDSMFGDVRDLNIYYFLADDTIQIKEIFPRNSGRDAPPTFLTRRKIPRNFNGIQPLGQDTFTVLNVLEGRYVPDCLGIGNKEVEYYKASDLSIGAHINVYGREVILVDCDPFTREYYRTVHGIEDFTPLKRPGVERNTIVNSERMLPPFNGWGTHEDSESNCKTVEQKPPKVDFHKFIKLDRYMLRFGARMMSDLQENRERLYVITYYLSDDTVSVFEIGARNSGFKEGDFFKRAKVLLPHQNLLTSERPKIYTPQHFFIGATLVINDFTFHLISADEFALKYMENSPFEFPKANVDKIMSKIREALRPKYKNFIAKYLHKVCESKLDGGDVSVVCFETMRDALFDLLGTDITEHEIVTIARYFSAETQPAIVCNRDLIRSTVHWELNRNLWDDMERLEEHLYHLIGDVFGFVSENTLFKAIRACRLPLKPSLIRNMFSVLDKNAAGDISVQEFLEFVNVKRYTSPPIQPVNLDIDVCPKLPATQTGRLIDWNNFIAKIGLEDELKHETE
ncbi:hypothetical protein HA402_012686 [Bradysia odoriphaga]|nr:hypothetical protein HA402_012686 [Bradysia odoriphaga]